MKRYKPLYEAHDYKLQHEAPTNDGYAKPLYNLTGIYPDDIYSAEGAKYYGDGSSFDNESINIIQKYKNKPNKFLTIYRAVPKILTSQEKIDEYEKQKAYILKTGKIPRHITNWSDKSEYYNFLYDEIERLKKKSIDKKIKIGINKGDWISINKKYAIFHGKTHLDNYKIISKQVKAKEIYSDGNSIHEWGYDPS